MKLKVICLLIVTLALGACAHPGEHRVPESYAAAPEDAAYLIGSIGFRSSGEHKSVNNFSRLIYRRKGVEHRGDIVMSQSWMFPVEIHYEEPGRKGRMFALPLQPGEYELVNVHFYYNNGQVEKSWEAKEDFSVPFSMEAGKAYYIGDFLARGYWGKNIFGITIPAGGHFVHRYNLGRDLPLLKAKFPELAEKDVVTLDLDAEVPPFIYSSETAATKGLPATN